jgi:hypothetical protein
MVVPIGELWYSRDPAQWDAALELYGCRLDRELLELDQR